MKNKKILKSGAIILSVLVFLINIVLCMKFISSLLTINQSEELIPILGAILGAFSQFIGLMKGLSLFIIVWLEYFIIYNIIKSLGNPQGKKKIALFFILLFTSIILFIIFIGQIRIIFDIIRSL